MKKVELLKRKAETLSSALHGVYIEACEEAGRAISPEDIGLPGWACDLLAEAYEARQEMDSEPKE